jgi:spermidine synthase
MHAADGYHRDGRLELTKLPDHSFDLIALDAFSSDSIPTHIVTKEAFALYLTKLRPNGAIALHITNRFFNLEPMLAALTRDMGIHGLYGRSMLLKITATEIDFPTRWVVLAPEAATIERLRSQNPMWRDLRGNPAVKAWTDEYSNLLAVLKWEREPVETPLPNPVEAR